MIVRVSTDGEEAVVRFIFDRDVPAEKVCLVGDFNGWDETSLPMEKTPDGEWALEMKLRAGDYQFKYLVDGVFYNDNQADDYQPNYWGSEDSVVKV